MVKSKVAYSREKIPSTFENFMNESITAIQTEKDFKAFMLHFEAVVGFSKEHLSKN
jgi:CRISPR-associated protein Csm2